MKHNFSLSVQYLYKTQDKMKVQFNKQRCKVVYRPDEYVLLLTEHLNLKNAPIHKLKRRFVGLFFVVSQLGPMAYELDFLQAWKIHNIFHVSLQQPFKTSS